MKSPLLYVGLLIVFALTAALIVPLFINWSNYRADIEAYGERMTGRQVKVNGEISLRLLPAPILRLGDVRVANPVEAAAADLLVARTIEAKLALAPLLRGKVEITTVEVEAPVIEAENLPGGGTWELSPMGGFERLLEAEDIRLVDARITSGTLVVRDPSREFTARLEDLDMSLEAPSLAGPFKARGTFTHDGVRREFGLSVGRRRVDRPTHVAVTLAPGSGWGKEYSLDGTIGSEEGGPTFTGRMRIVEAEAEAGGKQDKVDVGLAQIVPFELRSAIVATLDEAVLDDVQFIFGSGRSRATMTGRARVDIWNGPRLDAKLSARRLDLDAVVASQVGEDAVQATPSTREILNQIPRLLEFLPKTLSGQLAMDVDGLVLGGHQIEGAGVTLRFAPGALTVSRAVGRLPGQSQVSVTGTYHPDAEDTDFDGIFSLQARDAKTFLTWLAPRLETVLDPKAGGARGNLSLQGELRVREALVELIGVEATVDGNKARLGLSVALTERPAFGLRLVLDEFNLDRYLPPPTAAAEDEAGAMPAETEGGNPLSILGEFDANIVVRAAHFVARGTTMRDISADLTLRGGNLDVKQFSVADLGGARIVAKGNLTDVVHKPEGRIEASLDADDPGGFITLISGGRADAADPAWTGGGPGWGPARLVANLQAVGGETPKIILTGSGTLGGSKAEIDGAFEGSLDAPGEARTSLQVALANDKGYALLRQIGIAADAPPKDKSLPGVLRGELAGTLAEGLKLAVGVEALGAEVSIDGTARRIAGTTSLEAEAKVAAADAGPLYRALGLIREGKEAAGGLDLRALIAGKDGEYVITGLTGTVADNPVSVNGVARMGGEVPEFRLTANIARVSLPWALGLLVGGNGGIDNPVALAVAATGTNSAAPVWSPLPFETGNLDRVALDLKADVGTLDVGGGLNIRSASFGATLSGGELQLADVKGQLFGGTVGLTASVSATRDLVTVESEYVLEEADLAQVSRFAAAEAEITGTATVRGKVRGSGRNMHALMSSLSGEGRVAVADMALQKFDAAAFAEALREARDEEQVENAAKTVLAGDELELGSLDVGYKVASGLVRVDPVDVGGGVASGRMSTQVDLAAWRFDNEWQLSFSRIENAPALAVSIGGLIGDGTRSLDIRELKTFLTMKALHEDMVRLEEMERRAREQIRKEEESLRRVEEEARREREEEQREALEQETRQHQAAPRAPNETTIVPRDSPGLDQPLMLRDGASGPPDASDGQPDLPKQVDRIGPARRSDGVIRIGPDGRLPLPGQSSGPFIPEAVEKQALPPPGE